MLKFIALQLMSYFNSINTSETSITLTSFMYKRENFPDFLCMIAMHTIISPLFLASHPGMLHRQSRLVRHAALHPNDLHDNIEHEDEECGD
jgi:hypothetical protein